MSAANVLCRLMMIAIAQADDRVCTDPACRRLGPSMPDVCGATVVGATLGGWVAVVDVFHLVESSVWGCAVTATRSHPALRAAQSEGGVRQQHRKDYRSDARRSGGRIRPGSVHIV